MKYYNSITQQQAKNILQGSVVITVADTTYNNINSLLTNVVPQQEEYFVVELNDQFQPIKIINIQQAIFTIPPNLSFKSTNSPNNYTLQKVETKETSYINSGFNSTKNSIKISKSDLQNFGYNIGGNFTNILKINNLLFSSNFISNPIKLKNVNVINLSNNLLTNTEKLKNIGLITYDNNAITKIINIDTFEASYVNNIISPSSNRPPQIKLISPTSFPTTINHNTTRTFFAAAYDIDEENFLEHTSIKWYLNGLLKSTGIAGTVKFDTLGQCELKVEVTDQDGAKAEIKGMVEVLEVVVPPKPLPTYNIKVFKYVSGIKQTEVMFNVSEIEYNKIRAGTYPDIIYIGPL